MRQLIFNLFICAVAVPVDLFFLVWSTVKLTLSGFGFTAAFRYSLNR